MSESCKCGHGTVDEPHATSDACFPPPELSAAAEPTRTLWPTDGPSGWNSDAAKFLATVQACPHMWLVLSRAKYIELRIDTRDGGFNLYDRDRKRLNPDDVIRAIESANANFVRSAAVSPHHRRRR